MTSCCHFSLILRIILIFPIDQNRSIDHIAVLADSKKKKNCFTKVHFVGPLIDWTLCDPPHGFQCQGGSLACTLSCLHMVNLKVTFGATPTFSTNMGVWCMPPLFHRFPTALEQFCQKYWKLGNIAYSADMQVTHV